MGKEHTGCAHQRRQFTGSHVALDILQQLALSLLIRDDVVDVAKGKDGLVLGDALHSMTVVITALLLIGFPFRHGRCDVSNRPMLLVVLLVAASGVDG